MKVYGNEAARRRGNCERAKCVHQTRSIVADRDTAALVAGLSLAISFGLMFLWAAVMW